MTTEQEFEAFLVKDLLRKIPDDIHKYSTNFKNDYQKIKHLAETLDDAEFMPHYNRFEIRNKEELNMIINQRIANTEARIRDSLQKLHSNN